MSRNDSSRKKSRSSTKVFLPKFAQDIIKINTCNEGTLQHYFIFSSSELHEGLGSTRFFTFLISIHWCLHWVHLPEHSRSLKIHSLLFNLWLSCRVPPWNVAPLLLIVRKVFARNFPQLGVVQVKVCISSHQFSSVQIQPACFKL